MSRRERSNEGSIVREASFSDPELEKKGWKVDSKRQVVGLASLRAARF